MMTQAHRCFGQNIVPQISHRVAEENYGRLLELLLNQLLREYRREVTSALCVVQ
jgi:hypothetical protein